MSATQSKQSKFLEKMSEIAVFAVIQQAAERCISISALDYPLAVVYADSKKEHQDDYDVFISRQRDEGITLLMAKKLIENAGGNIWYTPNGQIYANALVGMHPEMAMIKKLARSGDKAPLEKELLEKLLAEIEREKHPKTEAVEPVPVETEETKAETVESTMAVLVRPKEDSVTE